MDLNDPDVVRTLEQLHDAYERALGVNDVDALDAFFWNAPGVVRYGVSEQLYGIEAVRAYRLGPTPAQSGRRVVRRQISTFGSSCATVMAEVEVIVDGRPRPVRQSQTWMLLAGIGWRIVAAHVSIPKPPVPQNGAWGAYADAMAGCLGMPPDAVNRPSVVANLERTAAIAAPLLAFPLTDVTEPAPIFAP